MEINVLFKVKSKEVLREILQTGKAYSLLDYEILNHKVQSK